MTKIYAGETIRIIESEWFPDREGLTATVLPEDHEAAEFMWNGEFMGQFEDDDDVYYFRYDEEGREWERVNE
jgi:hypothetical protein